MTTNRMPYSTRPSHWREHVGQDVALTPPAVSDKSRTVALALAAVLGVFGAHRFYVGKTGTALLMLVTLGGLGIWWLFDLILIAAGGFTDEHGCAVVDWDPGSGLGLPRDRQELEAAFLEMERMRADIDELSERLDFAERLLASPEHGRTT